MLGINFKKFRFKPWWKTKWIVPEPVFQNGRTVPMNLTYTWYCYGKKKHSSVKFRIVVFAKELNKLNMMFITWERKKMFEQIICIGHHLGMLHRDFLRCYCELNNTWKNPERFFPLFSQKLFWVLSVDF